MTRFILIASLFCAATLTLPGVARAQGSDGLGRTVLMYLPNRVLDLFDVVRLNAKIGQGIAGGVRATEQAEGFIGTYSSLYVGLPGPRGGPDPRLPVGFESREEKPGQVLDIPKTDAPKYGRGEIGIDLFPFVAGAAVGVDVFELVDFFGGIVGFDIAKDEL